MPCGRHHKTGHVVTVGDGHSPGLLDLFHYFLRWRRVSSLACLAPAKVTYHYLCAVGCQLQSYCPAYPSGSSGHYCVLSFQMLGYFLRLLFLYCYCSEFPSHGSQLVLLLFLRQKPLLSSFFA